MIITHFKWITKVKSPHFVFSTSASDFRFLLFISTQEVSGRVRRGRRSLSLAPFYCLVLSCLFLRVQTGSVLAQL